MSGMITRIVSARDQSGISYQRSIFSEANFADAQSRKARHREGRLRRARLIEEKLDRPRSAKPQRVGGEAREHRDDANKKESLGNLSPQLLEGDNTAVLVKVFGLGLAVTGVGLALWLGARLFNFSPIYSFALLSVGLCTVALALLKGQQDAKRSF